MKGLSADAPALSLLDHAFYDAVSFLLNDFLNLQNSPAVIFIQLRMKKRISRQQLLALPAGSLAHLYHLQRGCGTKKVVYSLSSSRRLVLDKDPVQIPVAEHIGHHISAIIELIYKKVHHRRYDYQHRQQKPCGIAKNRIPDYAACHSQRSRNHNNQAAVLHHLAGTIFIIKYPTGKVNSILRQFFRLMKLLQQQLAFPKGLLLCQKPSAPESYLSSVFVQNQRPVMFILILLYILTFCGNRILLLLLHILCPLDIFFITGMSGACKNQIRISITQLISISVPSSIISSCLQASILRIRPDASR